MSKLFSRGLNLHGQCGLGRNINYSTKFIPIDLLGYDVSSIYTNYGQSYVLLDDLKSLIFFGFSYDIRTFQRTSYFHSSFPRLTRFLFRHLSHLKYIPKSPVLLNKFNNTISDVQVGSSFCLVIDNMGLLYSIGDNLYGQTGNKLQIISSSFINILPDLKFKKIAAGYQHSLFLTYDGLVYGSGKCDKLQLGLHYPQYIKDNSSINLSDLTPIDLKLNFDSPVIDIGAGKYHSIFLTENGSVYAIGANRFGQLGDSNMNVHLEGEPFKIEFEDKDEKIVKIVCGDNHNLMLSSKGILYVNGYNAYGQLDGKLNETFYYLCSPKMINFDEKIINIYAKNNRSAVLMENGDAYYWGGLFYEPGYSFRYLPKFEGINKYNNEDGLPIGCKIQDIGIGYLHDLILIK